MIKVQEISDRLTARVEAVCQKLLPSGKTISGDWVCGDVTGSAGDSLKVHLTGSHAGKWRDWSTDEHGDLIDLWAACHSLSIPEALKEVKEYLGIHEEFSTLSTKTYSKPPADIAKPLTPEGKAEKWLTDTRKLSKETLAVFRVEIAAEQKAIVFPCYSPSGELVNRSYRTLPSSGEKKKVWQDKGCAPCMFGWQSLSTESFKGRSVLLCEGQIDCMTWHQWGVTALSIPNGTGASWIEYEWDNLAVFDLIYISFDMDGAGAENVRKVIQRLGIHRCLVVSLPWKDANECLQRGCNASEALEWVKNAKPPVMEGIILGSQLLQRVLQEFEEKKQPHTLSFFDLKWPYAGFYPHPGDVTVWTGPTGHGKSSFLNYLIFDLVSLRNPIFIASMEITAQRIVRKLLHIWKGGYVDTSNISYFLENAGHLLCFADVVGYIEPKKLLEMMHFSFRRHGCQHFIIDSLMRVKGLEEDYPAQGDFMNELARFAKQYGVNVEIVCHPRKKQAGERVTEMDIKGSSLIANNADNVLSIIKNPTKDKLRKEGTITPKEEEDMHDAEVRVDKQREVGWTGLFKLKYNPKTFTFTGLTVVQQ